MSGGNFFAVDRRKWAQACSLGLNDAVVYLVQARGSGRDQSNSSWSVQAVENYTGISRSRAKASIQSLQKADLTRLVKGGTHPRYEIRLWQEPRKKTPSPPEWIFLPNTFVTSAANETPPLELLRQTQDSMALRLAVDLYHVQNLAEDGGVSRGVAYQRYERYEVGRQGQYTVYGFQAGATWVCWGETTTPHRREDLTDDEKQAGKNAGVDFFARMELLQDTGLIEWVPHLVEGEDPGTEVIHPLAMNHADTSLIENRIGRAAHRAGAAMLTERQREWAQENGLLLVPVPRHFAQVQVRGIARLRYRPQTSMTAAWWGELNGKGEQWAKRYDGLAAKPAQWPAALEA